MKKVLKELINVKLNKRREEERVGIYKGIDGVKMHGWRGKWNMDRCV